MRMVIDSNILVRCSVGRASLDVAKLRERNVALATTTRSIAETIKVLVNVFSIPEDIATEEVADSTSAFEIYDESEFSSYEHTAKQRLHERGEPDWPILAAALELDAHIWSDDRDFFGVGSPVWSTRNIRFAEARG
jgi:predicted nucleic acid-binding protein